MTGTTEVATEVATRASRRASLVCERTGLGLYTTPAGQLQLAAIADRHGWREMAATLRRIARGEVAL